MYGRTGVLGQGRAPHGRGGPAPAHGEGLLGRSAGAEFLWKPFHWVFKEKNKIRLGASSEVMS